MSEQFADAPEDSNPALKVTEHLINSHRDPTGAVTYIDDPLHDESDTDISDEEEYDSEDEREWLASVDHGVDDEDWEIAEKDFTKQYNRLKQHNTLSGTQGPPTPASAGQGVLPAINRPKPKTAQAAPTVSRAERKQALDKKVSDQLTALSKYTSRIASIDEPYAPRQGDSTFTLGVSVNRKGPSAQANQKDKADRATNEQVLDPRTRIILFKMIGRELVKEINGCVSTGKEANVYHALTPTGAHLALKIYKTSILVFKDRDRYVTGEFRFRRGYSRHNPRKMVRLWAEKEMRNLKRLKSAGVRCPDAVEVRENVLVMEFLGDPDGWASPRLKDAQIPSERYETLYRDLMLTVRKIYHTCRLVHADLSEYNILYHEDELWIIDVSQSVEQDHPSAFEFLRMDLKNVKAFFESKGVHCLSVVKGFEFVTKEGFSDKDEGATLDEWLEETDDAGVAQEDAMSEEVKTKLEDEAAAHKATEDSVFMRSFIPRSLNEMVDPEKALASATAQDAPSPPAKKVAKVKFTGVPQQEGESDYEEESEEGSEGDDDEKGEFTEKRPRGHRHEDKEAKKERKKATKEAQREKRTTKMPKAEKKKRIKNSRGGG
ncbi:hypothetical protein M408DRAFT_331003 [Serendipita vermifera MAFF 305830]|uniref:Serine/threonine-protein kinase RIO1 n=1 Tax=Serendipita vermifera MAFF 305830 TaxID=933852 RepID=A0A0C3B2S2_SERVB|nr:hypothetical protein M408DRAFT_331003 [Serendipita vermifera MAFF 305830]